MDERFARLRTITFLVVGVGAMLLVLPLLCIRVDTATSSYATYAEAEREGAVQRGWIPAFVPASATEIREVRDPRHDRQWLRFQLPLADARTMVAAMSQLSLGEARALSGTRPGQVGLWPAELNPSFSAAPRGEDELSIYRAPEHVAGPRCVAIEWPMLTVYAWSC